MSTSTITLPKARFPAPVPRGSSAPPGGPCTSPVESLCASRLASICTLWDRLSDFHPVESVRAIRYLLATLQTETGAESARWIGFEKSPEPDTMPGVWSAPLVIDSQSDQTSTIRYPEKELHGFAGLRVLSGRCRTLFLRDETGGHDQLCAVVALSPTCEIAVILGREKERRPFSQSDQAMLFTGMRGAKWFHRQAALSLGLLQRGSRLTPRERTVLKELLSDKIEKEIADTLGLSVATVRSYTKIIYRKYRVRGRSGLAALWVNPR